MRIVLIGSESAGLGAALAAHLHVDHIRDVGAATGDGFVLDGAPRDVAEAMALDTSLRARAADLDAVLWLPIGTLSPQADAVLEYYAGRIVQLDAGGTPLEAALDGLREALLV